MKRKRKPWRVTPKVPGRNIEPTDFTSQEKAYEHVRELVAGVKTGHSDVQKITVRHWEHDVETWGTYEVIDPKEW